jgi:hypothetical protein
MQCLFPNAAMISTGNIQTCPFWSKSNLLMVLTIVLKLKMSYSSKDLVLYFPVNTLKYTYHQFQNVSKKQSLLITFFNVSLIEIIPSYKWKILLQAHYCNLHLFVQTIPLVSRRFCYQSPAEPENFRGLRPLRPLQSCVLIGASRILSMPL